MLTSILVAIAIIVAVALLLVFLSIGVVIFAIVAVVGIIAGIIAMMFGSGGEFNIFNVNDGREVVDSFYQCLLDEAPEICRAKFTTWGDGEKDIAEGLARQAKSDLGAREGASSSSYNSHSVNGKREVTLEMVSDFERHDDVKERYRLVNDGDSLKIQEVAWDY